MIFGLCQVFLIFLPDQKVSLSRLFSGCWLFAFFFRLPAATADDTSRGIPASLDTLGK
jgi:hypothetical protein